MKNELKEHEHLRWEKIGYGNYIFGNYGIRKVVDYDYEVFMYEVYNDYYKDKPSIKRFFKMKHAKLFVELIEIDG